MDMAIMQVDDTQVQITPEFANAVQEYKLKKDEVMQDFIVGVAELGSILAKHRQVMKQERNWLDYCSAIGLSVASANQQIRLFEYKKELSDQKAKALTTVITNWSKLNAFLTLPNPSKDELLEDEALTEDTSNQDFRDKVVSVKPVDAVEELVDEQNIDEVAEADPEDEQIMFDALKHMMDSDLQDENILLDNPKETAKKIQTEYKMGVHLRGYFEGIIHVQKGLTLLNDTTKLNRLDRSRLMPLLQEQLDLLNKLIAQYK